jgi:hypothetical protein
MKFKGVLLILDRHRLIYVIVLSVSPYVTLLRLNPYAYDNYNTTLKYQIMKKTTLWSNVNHAWPVASLSEIDIGDILWNSIFFNLKDGAETYYVHFTLTAFYALKKHAHIRMKLDRAVVWLWLGAGTGNIFPAYRFTVIISITNITSAELIGQLDRGVNWMVCWIWPFLRQKYKFELPPNR